MEPGVGRGIGRGVALALHETVLGEVGMRVVGDPAELHLPGGGARGEILLEHRVAVDLPGEPWEEVVPVEGLEPLLLGVGERGRAQFVEARAQVAHRLDRHAAVGDGDHLVAETGEHRLDGRGLGGAEGREAVGRGLGQRPAPRGVADPGHHADRRQADAEQEQDQFRLDSQPTEHGHLRATAQAAPRSVAEAARSGRMGNRCGSGRDGRWQGVERWCRWRDRLRAPDRP